MTRALRGRVAAPGVLEATGHATAAPSARTATTRPGEVCQLDSYARPVRISSLLGRCCISRLTGEGLGEMSRRERMGGVDETTSQRGPFARNARKAADQVEVTGGPDEGGHTRCRNSEVAKRGRCWRVYATPTTGEA